MTLGEKIQILRKQRGMSQEQLAARILVTRQAISKWELSESLPDVDNIVQLSEMFNVTTDYLLKNGAAINNTSTIAAESTPDYAEPEIEVQPDTKTSDMNIPDTHKGIKSRVLNSPMAIGILGMACVGLNMLRRSHENALFPLAGAAIIIGMVIVFLPHFNFHKPADTGLRLGKFMSDAGIIAIIASGMFFRVSHARMILLYASIIGWVGLAVVGLCIVHGVFRNLKPHHLTKTQQMQRQLGE